MSFFRPVTVNVSWYQLRHGLAAGQKMQSHLTLQASVPEPARSRRAQRALREEATRKSLQLDKRRED